MQSERSPVVSAFLKIVSAVAYPANGQPIMLMADCGTVGGYPKIATVVSVDRGRLALLGVRAELTFEVVTADTARSQFLEQESRLAIFAEES